MWIDNAKENKHFSAVFMIYIYKSVIQKKKKVLKNTVISTA